MDLSTVCARSTYADRMSTTANDRPVGAPAPGGLRLVQELLNTASSGVWTPTADLLVDRRAATEWARAWMPSARIDDRTTQELRSLRDALRRALRGEIDPTVTAASVELTLSSGAVGIAAGDAPVGQVLAEVLLAQARGDWPRLKVCALEVCGTAFWDRSRNTSGRFHSPRCANAVNLPASRERRRAAQSARTASDTF
jgi:hypothetical protein